MVPWCRDAVEAGVMGMHRIAHAGLRRPSSGEKHRSQARDRKPEMARPVYHVLVQPVEP